MKGAVSKLSWKITFEMASAEEVAKPRNSGADNASAISSARAPLEAILRPTMPDILKIILVTFLIND
jgi:hypothetical protein